MMNGRGCWLVVLMVLGPFGAAMAGVPGDLDCDGMGEGFVAGKTGVLAGGSAKAVEDGRFIAVSYSETDMFVVDPVSGPIPMGTAPDTHLQALALSPQGALYAGTNEGDVYIIDPDTGAATYVVTLQGWFLSLRGMAFRSDGGLFVSYETNDGYLGTANLSTGEITPVGAVTGPWTGVLQGLAFDAEDNLFGIAPDNGLQPGLYSVNASTAAATLISDPEINVYQAITFTDDGRLFALGSNAIQVGHGLFCELDPATGAPIGEPLDTGAHDTRGMEFVPYFYPGGEILCRPTPGYIKAGHTVWLTAPEGSDYQWRKDGVEIEGATGRVLVIENVSAADECVYTVVYDGGKVIKYLSQPHTLTLLADGVLPVGTGLFWIVCAAILAAAACKALCRSAGARGLEGLR